MLWRAAERPNQTRQLAANPRQATTMIATAGARTRRAGCFEAAPASSSPTSDHFWRSSLMPGPWCHLCPGLWASAPDDQGKGVYLSAFGWSDGETTAPPGTGQAHLPFLAASLRLVLALVRVAKRPVLPGQGSRTSFGSFASRPRFLPAFAWTTPIPRGKTAAFIPPTPPLEETPCPVSLCLCSASLPSASPRPPPSRRSR